MTTACGHLDQELIFEQHDGFPCLVEVRCENCGADVIENYTEKERAEIERDERSYQYDEQYESAKEAWLESLRESSEGSL